MFAYILSNLAGLIRQMMVSNTFGTSQQLDAFYAAVTVPDFLFNLLAGGALASAFIPIFTDLLKQRTTKEAFSLASAVVSLILLFLGSGSILTTFFAPQVVGKVLFVLKPELDPQTMNLSVDLLRIILIAPTIFGVSGIVMGILNTHQKFLVPALAPVANWLGWILGILLFVPSMGIYGLAWGYVLGAIFHLGIQLPSLAKLPDFELTLPSQLFGKDVIQVLKLVGPRLFGVGAVQVNFLVNTMLAASLAEGSLSAINVGRMVMTMPLFVIAQAIATAALPTFSALVAKEQKEEMVKALVSTLRGVLFLSLPASVGLIAMRSPITEVLFQRGNFDSHSTELVSWAILWYTAGLVGHALVEILSRAFYALHDTKTPVSIGIGAMGLNVAFSFLFVWWFEKVGWMPHGGLALANSLATAIEAVILVIAIRKPLGTLDMGLFLRGVIQFSLASVIMGVAVWGWIAFSAGYGALAQTIGAMIAGVGVYGIAVILMKNGEAVQLLNFALRRLGMGQV